MEFESLELTTENIFQLHRDWITKLFGGDNMSEVEIKKLLYECRLLVTLQQRIEDWDLLSTKSQLPSPVPLEQDPDVQNLPIRNSPGLGIDTSSVSDGWELVKSNSQTRSRSRLSESSSTPNIPSSPTYTQSPVMAKFQDPPSINLYKERPLPALPSTSGRKRKGSNILDRPAKDKLKVTCHHGEEFHTVEMTLGILSGQGPSPIETYTSDDQRFERFAIGLERDLDRNQKSCSSPTLGSLQKDLPRADQWTGDRS